MSTPPPPFARGALGTDLSHAARELLRTPRWTITMVVTLGVVIGTCTAFLALYDGAYHHSVDAEAADRLVILGTPTAERNLTNISHGVLEAIRTSCRSFVSVAAAMGEPALTDEAEPERLNTVRLTPAWLDTVRPALALGPGPTAADYAADAQPVALISHRYWQRRFGGRADVVGQQVALQDGRRVEVRGVLGQGFESPTPEARPLQMWLPFRAAELAFRCQYRCNDFIGVGRLAPGVTIEQARQEVTDLLEDLKRRHPDLDRTTRAQVLAFTSVNMGGQQEALATMFDLSQFLFYVGAANLSVAILWRALRRRREHALRLALGAWGGRLVRLIVMESCLLALASVPLGAAVAAAWIALAKVGYVSAFELNPGFRATTLTWSTLGYATLIALIVAVMICMPAAFMLSRLGLHAALKESSRSHTGARSVTLMREMLLAVQVALTVILQMESNVTLTAVTDTLTRPGFVALSVRQMQIDFPEGRLWGNQNQFKAKVLAQLSELPRVRAAALVSPAPLAPQLVPSLQTIALVAPHGGPSTTGQATRRAVGGDLLGVLHMRQVSGRMLAEGDHLNPARPVVIDSAFARRFFPGRDPLGQRIAFDNGDDDNRSNRSLPWTIVGVIGDVLSGANQSPEPTFYTPYQLNRTNTVHFLVKSVADAAYLDAGMRAAVRAAEPRQPVHATTSYLTLMIERIIALVSTTVVISVIATLAWLLALGGLHASAAALIDARINEIGLRMAIGASPMGIVLWALKLNWRPVAAGTGVATLLLLASTLPGFPLRLLGDLPLRLDWLALSIAGVLGPIFLAVALPARRARRRPPMALLRHE